MDYQGKALEIRDEKRKADRSCQIHEKKKWSFDPRLQMFEVRVNDMPGAESDIGKVTWPAVVV